MKQSLQRDAGQVAKLAEPTRSRPGQQQGSASGGHLAQLSAMINASPKAESLMTLAAEINQSSPVQRLREAGGAKSGVNSPAQLRLEVEGTLAHGDRSGNSMGGESADAGGHSANESSCGCGVKANSRSGSESDSLRSRKLPAQKKDAARASEINHEIRAEQAARAQPRLQKEKFPAQRVPVPLHAQLRCCSSSSKTIQRKWIDAVNGLLQWDTPMDGLTWFYDPETAGMTFQGNRWEMPENVLSELGKWRTHGEWQKMGWGIEPAPQEKGSPPFEKLVETGRRRWEELHKVGPDEPPHKESQAARDWFFENYYSTSEPDDRGGNKLQIESNYKFRPQSMDVERDKGQYANTFDTHAGEIIADMNYALGAGEKYYDPVTEKAERMSNSEILFQQWRKAVEVQKPEKPKLNQIKRDHVAGDGRVMLKVIQEKIFDGKTFQDVELRPQDQAFYAVLAVPNATSSIWLIRDHGVELGIKGIASITLLKQKSLIIKFY